MKVSKQLPHERFFADVTYREEVANNIARNRNLDPKRIREEIEKFCLYWLELDFKTGRHRYQDQKFFDVRARLASWLSRVKGEIATSFPPNEQEDVMYTHYISLYSDPKAKIIGNKRYYETKESAEVAVRARSKFQMVYITELGGHYDSGLIAVIAALKTPIMKTKRLEKPKKETPEKIISEEEQARVRKNLRDLQKKFLNR